MTRVKCLALVCMSYVALATGSQEDSVPLAPLVNIIRNIMDGFWHFIRVFCKKQNTDENDVFLNVNIAVK